ncbi:N-acetylmuramoyl-L-alanine amidase [Sedimentibacter sp. MB31-C6]|uniref:N-acetylmuramoyl-L-alanine amidase n=1 Tax=Sedimentibacter sp. MB31-C6 TaxID=3109366 RepID=UPI002DDCC07F|nr:N-acetylmuramoyl-L-alanine amidase [Sedimentibacter sp. MB36-C1]WSI03830.1 N-acetylmuramoyl-L-alanine amidase [Sedimentibacter sp. MB36-C1]
MKKFLILLFLILTFTITVTYGETITGYTNISNIGIYNEPNYTSSVNDILKLNTKVKIIEENNDWYKVKTEDGKNGWIEKYFINVPASRYVVNYSNYRINIRTSPTTGSKIVGQLLPNEKAKYIDTYHSWHIIEYNGSEYYVASWLTNIVSKELEEVYLLHDMINIRDDASTNSNIIVQGNKNDSYIVLGESNGWLKVELPNKQTGYVAGWLTTYDLNYYSEGHYGYKLTSDNLNLRTGPSSDNEKITTIKTNSSVKVIATENGWDKVLYDNGQVGWCSNDYLKTINPLRGKKILLDPGHGGKDPGAISFTGKYEKHINLTVAYKLKDKLEKLGATVYMTRNDDTYINNTARGKMADNLNADILLSIHHNSLGNSDYFGLSTYYNTINYKDTKHGYDLAESIYLNAVTINGVYRDGILDRNYEVLRETNTPAALIEIGFMSNPKEEMNIHDASFQNLMVQKIADGIIDYFLN